VTVRVYVPARVMARVSKLATPLWASTEVVPSRVAAVLLTAMVTLEASLVTTLPYGSSIWAVRVERVWPAEVLVGCWVRTSWVAAAGVTAKLPE